jgi:hypothetical protein
MEDLSLHILDVAENSIEAQAKRIEIRIKEDRGQDRLSLEISDDGRGMDEALRTRAADPFVTTRRTRPVGMGLPLLAQAAEATGGGLTIDSNPGRGTQVRASFRLSHIDLKPLGDIAQTVVTLIAGHPEIDIRYVHTFDGRKYAFDTRDLRSQIEGIPLNAPEILALIRKDIEKGLAETRKTP